MIVETEAAVALLSGAFAAAAVFVVVDFPGVLCVPPLVAGPAALESLFNSSSTKPGQ